MAHRFVRPDLASAVYHGVESIEALAEELGIEVEEIVKLNANENQYGAPEVCVSAIVESLSRKTHVYPDPTQGELRGVLGEHHGVDPGWIVAGAGSDDILDMLLRATAPEAVVIAPPTFGMYGFLSKLNHSIPVIEVERDADFHLAPSAVLDAVAGGGGGGSGCRAVVFLPSPNNPTGNLVALEEVKELCEGLRECLVVIDEAYIEFAPEGASALSLVEKYDNLVVCRTFSKWAGLAGTRIGYCVAAPDLVSTLLAIKQPYNVNSAAEAGALAAIVHKDAIVEHSVSKMLAERRSLFVRLAAMAPMVRPCPSDANFVLSELSSSARVTAGELAAELRSCGILIRYFAKQGGDLESFFRISAGKPEDTDAVVGAIRDILGLDPESSVGGRMEGLGEGVEVTGVIFDMDGVLAEVSKSYREAIIQTASAYGVTVSHADIDEIKAAGNANNDWDVTHRLVEGGGGSASLEEVTATFEGLYHGGLYKNETLLVAYDLLYSLKQAGFPLGIVTGRPRDPDAMRFLEDFGLTELFDVVVTPDDAASKPSPEPVLLACERLGLDPGGVLMLGDTVDDVVSAVGAGAIPVGVLPPTAVGGGLRGVLEAAGAVCVLGPGCFELAQLISPP